MYLAATYVETSKKEEFEKIYKNYVDAIFRFVYIRVSNRELAQDITADTYSKLWVKILNGNDIRNPKALLYIIARGLVIDYYRKNKNIKIVSAELIEIEVNHEKDILEEISEEEELIRFYTALKEIKQIYQDVIIMRYVEEMTINEISIILKKNANSIRVLLHRAIQALKKKI